jgi:GTP cyclohydrolase I
MANPERSPASVESREPNLSRAAELYKAFCQELGIDLTKPDTEGTPERVARLFHSEFLVGQRDIPFDFTTFPIEGDKADQLVTVTGIRFVSICAHHHLPIIGYAHVCYLPGKKLVGLSKLARLVEWRAARPTVQEELTYDIAQELIKRCEPQFVGVKLIATHECMACRGVRSYESRTHTERLWCKDDNMAEFATTRAEFASNISEWYQAKGIL